MSTVTVLTGSLGSGKTTVGRLLADGMRDGVHIETDLFYKFLSHPIPPHLPEADGQNQAAIAASCQAAKSLALRGYNVVLEGILGPWFATLIQREFEPEVIDVRYVILRTTLEEAKSRVHQRGDTTIDHVIAAMHPQLQNLGEWEVNVVESTHMSAAEVAQVVQSGLAQGRFSIRVATHARGA